MVMYENTDCLWREVMYVCFYGHTNRLEWSLGIFAHKVALMQTSNSSSHRGLASNTLLAVQYLTYVVIGQINNLFQHLHHMVSKKTIAPILCSVC